MYRKAVILSRFVPWPAVTGAFLGSSLLISQVTEFAHEIVLIAADNPFGTQPSPDGLRIVSEPAPMWAKKTLAVNYLGSGLPFAAQPFAIPALRQHALEELANADLVVIDHIGACWALDLALAARERGARLLYNAMNVESDTRRTAIRAGGLRAVFASFDARRVETAEHVLITESDLVICVSSEDLDRFREMGASAELVVVNPVHGNPPKFVGLSGVTDFRIVMVGSFYWRAKQENLLRFLAARNTTKGAGGVGVRIVGNMPEKFHRKVARLFSDVEITGRVDCIEEHLEGCRIGVIPEDEGGGFKLKALDYAYAGLPIFGLEVGVKGLPLVDGFSMRAFSTMEELWRGIVANIEDVDALRQLRDNAILEFESDRKTVQRAALATAINAQRSGM